MRLADHPALAAAGAAGSEVICLYILETNDTLRHLGGASIWWLDKSLKALRSDISRRGGKLVCRRGEANSIIPGLVRETGAGGVYWGRRYGLAERNIDEALKSRLKASGLDVKSFNTTLLTEPWTFETGSGGYYKVFTPYWRALKSAYTAPDPLPVPEKLSGQGLVSDRIEEWGLHPSKPDWSTGFDAAWLPGEAGARERLTTFLDMALRTYEGSRNRPDQDRGTSGLSPHMRFGEISPVQVWRAVMARIAAGLPEEASAWTFLSEIAWREFSYVLLYNNPDFARENYNRKFDGMPWRQSNSGLKAWRYGRTGYPVVDAGMRELSATGWMHNRVRMITASFLTKHLLLHWRDGESWFWDQLVDADPASNPAGWQWTAGSGADAAPYFRIFNPITQGQKFDKTGAYVRRWCPELAALPDKYLHAPWTADAETLQSAGVRLGETYPLPIIKHSEGRQRALDAWHYLKQAQDAA